MLTKLKDYGIIDYIYAKTSPIKINKNEYQTFKKEIINQNLNPKEAYICFLPWRTTINEAKKLGLIPKTTKTIVYQGPVGIVNKNPHQTKQLLKQIEIDIKFEIKSNKLKEFNILCYSIGTYMGFHIANKFSAKKLIAVVPGSKVGETIWDGIATQKIKNQSIKEGFLTPQIYDKILNPTNPIENISNLPENIEIYIGTHDKFIKPKHSQDLINAIEKIRTPKIIKYQSRGHVLSLAKFGKENNL